MDSLKSKAISSVFWKLFERGGNAIVLMLVQIVMARLLGPEQFGALAVMLVFVNLGNVFVQSGLNTALIQARDCADSDYSTVFWMSFVISACIYLVIFISAPFLADYYRIPSLLWPLRTLSLLLVVNSYNSVQVAKITRELKMKLIFVATMFSSVCSAFVGICTAVCGGGLWALVAQQLTYQIVNCIALAFQVDWKPDFVFKTNRALMLFKFGWRLLLSSIIDQIYQSFADLIIGKRFSAASLGLVSQGKKYPLAVGSMLDSSIQPVMLSAVSRIQDDLPRVKQLVRRGLLTSTYLIVPIMTLFACIAPALVPAILGPQWIDSVPFMQIYCIVYAFLPVHSTNLQALNGMGRSDLFLKLELIKKTYGFAFVILCAFLFRNVNLLVASYLLSAIISTFVNAFPNKRVIGYGYFEQLKDIAPSFLLSLVSSVVVMVVPVFNLGIAPTIIIQVLLFFAVYISLSALFRLDALAYLVSTIKELVSSH